MVGFHLYDFWRCGMDNDNLLRGMKGLILLLLTSFVILVSYILYAGTAESLSATYYKVKKPYLFQLALGITGSLMKNLLFKDKGMRSLLNFSNILTIVNSARLKLKDK